MSKNKRLLAGVICVLGAALVVIACGLFRGHFDHGQFEVKETSRSSAARVAMVAKRSDHEAMSGDQYFVLLGDHVFSPSELRSAYYGRHVVFASDGGCLSVRWSDPHNLTVMCREGSIDPSHIAVQLRQAGDVVISYVNIPDKNSVAR
jgi:hypothetical protein